MKKFMALLTLVLIYMLVFSLTAVSEMMLEVAADTVNVRSGPGTAYEKAGTVKRGEQYRVVREQDGWYQIDYNGGSGWIISTYSKIINNDNLPVYINVDSGVVNVRSGAGTGYSRVSTITTGSNYRVVGEKNDWYQIEYSEGKTGYVAKWLVNVVFSADVPPPIENPFNSAGAYKQGTINSSVVNLREAGNTEAEILAHLTQGTRVALVSRAGDWYEVIVETGQSGWVSVNYISLDNVAMASSSVSEPPKFLPQAALATVGLINMSWESLSYGLRITLTSDMTIMCDVQPLLGGGYVFVTDMVIEGGGASFDDIKAAVTGEQRNSLTVSAVKPLRYEIQFFEGGRRLEIEIGYSPLLGKTIYVDPGHSMVNIYGNLDPGAIGPTGLRENEVVLDISLKLRDLLVAGGAKVYMIHTGKTYMTRFERAWLANETNVDIYVSVHANSLTTSSVNGTMVFTYAPVDDEGYDRAARLDLASKVQSRLLQYGGRRDLGVREENYDVLVQTSMPAILVEVAFISNPEEEALLASESFRSKMALGIYQGIYDYFDARR